MLRRLQTSSVRARLRVLQCSDTWHQQRRRPRFKLERRTRNTCVRWGLQQMRSLGPGNISPVGQADAFQSGLPAMRSEASLRLDRQTRRRLRRRRVRSRQQVLAPSPPVLRRLAPSLPVLRRLQCLDAWHQVVQRWDIWCFCHVQSCAQCHAQVQVSPEFAKMHPSLADAMHTAASVLQEVRCGDLSLAGSASGSEVLSADASTLGLGRVLMR